MEELVKKQLSLLEKIQEKVLISNNSDILLRLEELEGALGTYISFLSVLQNNSILEVVGVGKAGRTMGGPVLDVVSSFMTRPIDLRNLETNVFGRDDVLKLKVFLDFYQYFIGFSKENNLSDVQPEQKLQEVLEGQEIETIKKQLIDKQVIWRCYICRDKLPTITSENIEHYLTLFQGGKYKSCPKGHHNKFLVRDAAFQFLTEPLTFEDLRKSRLAEPLDKDPEKNKIESEN